MTTRGIAQEYRAASLPVAAISLLAAITASPDEWPACLRERLLYIPLVTLAGIAG
jgi:hypothetical protein